MIGQPNDDATNQNEQEDGYFDERLTVFRLLLIITSGGLHSQKIFNCNERKIHKLPLAGTFIHVVIQYISGS